MKVGKAKTFSSMGRGFLTVSGIAVAMQGDPCRDGDAPCGGKQWTYEGLEWARNRINHPIIYAIKDMLKRSD